MLWTLWAISAWLLAVGTVRLSGKHTRNKQTTLYLHQLPHKYQAGINKSLKQVSEDGLVHFTQCVWQGVYP